MFETVLFIAGFLFAFTVVIGFHEYGHYRAARDVGIIPTSFSIGFGPQLFGWVDRHGTNWKISLIPLGGFVSLADAEGKDMLRNFFPKYRLWVVWGGPWMSLVVGYFFIAAGLWLRNPELGLMGLLFALVVAGYIVVIALPLTIYVLVGMLFTGNTSELGSVVSMGEMGAKYSVDFASYIFMIGAFSVSIGSFNLLPFKPLDGGHMLSYAYEWWSGKPTSRWFDYIGIAVVLVLIGTALFNDIIKLIGYAVRALQ